MKKLISCITTIILLIGCGPEKNEEIAVSFTSDDLLSSLEILSHDSLEGRGFATIGNKKAQQFISAQFTKLGLEPAIGDSYVQPFDHIPSKSLRQWLYPVDNPGEDLINVPDTTLSGANIVAKIVGETSKAIVITAHYDHLGIRNGDIFNGADDDASGTAALFSIASHFTKNKPYHTLYFAALDAEEIGSPGCKYLADNFPGGIENVVLNVNMDMIAHNDSSELWASGTYHYPQLKEPILTIESNISLLFGHDDPNNKEVQDWTRSSDHRIFHDLGIPYIYFGVEDHKDYHRATDTFENINQSFYLDAVDFITEAVMKYDNFLMSADN